MNSQNSMSPRKPVDGAMALFFFLPLIGIAISLGTTVYTTCGGTIERGQIGHLLTSLGLNLPIFIGALLIGFAGMKDWRCIATVLLGVTALLSIGDFFLALPKIEIMNYGIVITIINGVLCILQLIASILLIVNKKDGSLFVRLSGLVFLFATIFLYVATFAINSSELVEDYRYISLGQAFICNLLWAISWIALAIGVIRERSARA